MHSFQRAKENIEKNEKLLLRGAISAPKLEILLQRISEDPGGYTNLTEVV